MATFEERIKLTGNLEQIQDIVWVGLRHFQTVTPVSDDIHGVTFSR
jgi:hypothetical protein